MKNLTSYILCALGITAILYLLWEKGVVIQDSTSLEVLDGYIYKVEYKVTQYEQQKSATNRRKRAASAKGKPRAKYSKSIARKVRRKK